MNRMRKTAMDKLKEAQLIEDSAEAHVEADEILCELLTKIGYEDVVKEYNKVGKWYS